MFIHALRVSVWPLRIQTGRYVRNNVPREQRYRLCCNYIVNVEDEFHVVLISPCYAALRNKYTPHYYINRPSMFKVLELLNVADKNKVYRNLLRNSFLNV